MAQPRVELSFPWIGLCLAVSDAVLNLCRTAEDEDEVGSEDEDEFYDRTAKGGAKKQKVVPEVHDAASLFGRKVPRPCHFSTCTLIVTSYQVFLRREGGLEKVRSVSKGAVCQRCAHKCIFC